MPLEDDLLTVYSARGLTLATAESCTGGLLAGRITDVPGSSRFFLGGVVSYANEVKENLLNIERAVLIEHGAVSEMVARQMARGVLDLLEADVTISITGVAGPGGGTLEKPVGLVWFGLADKDHTRAEYHIWGGDRAQNRELSVIHALRLLLQYAQTLD